MRALHQPAVGIGFVAGILLYANASVPYSKSYPFIWPLLGGAAALVWIGRHRTERLSAMSTLGIGAGVGALAALVAIVATLLTFGFMAGREHKSPPIVAVGTLGIVAAMLFAVPAALLGSILARPFVRPRLS